MLPPAFPWRPTSAPAITVRPVTPLKKNDPRLGGGRMSHKLQMRWPSALAPAPGVTFTASKDVAFTPFVGKRKKDNVGKR